MCSFYGFPDSGVAEVVGGGASEALPGHSAYVQYNVTVSDILVDSASCESRQP